MLNDVITEGKLSGEGEGQGRAGEGAKQGYGLCPESGLIPPGALENELHHRLSPALRQGGWPFVPLNQPVIGCGLPLVGGTLPPRWLPLAQGNSPNSLTL